jgi:hypothetical protein
MKFLHSGLVLMAGVLGAVTATGYTDVDATKMYRKPDIRETILQRFLSANHSPVESYAGNFIREADAHHLDWRLLPSLAWIESGAGQRNRKNNLFGRQRSQPLFDGFRGNSPCGRCFGRSQTLQR